MFLKLSSSICSLCEDTDVSLSEADTEHYIRFIKNDLGSDLNWVNSKSFKVCLLCTHSLHLLMEVVTSIENRNAKSCFCCKASSNLFKQNDLPKDHKANVASFASAFNIRGLNICLHCFYAINFWVKLKSFLESKKQANKSTIKAISNVKNGTHSPNSKTNNEISSKFNLPRDASKFVEIQKQVKTIKILQSKMNRVTSRKFAYDKKLTAQVPFVFLTRSTVTNDSTEPKLLSDDSDTEESSMISKFTSKKKVLNKSTNKKLKTRQNSTSSVKANSCSTDSDDALIVLTPLRNFQNKRAKVTPLNNNKNSPKKKTNTTSNGGIKTALFKNKKNADVAIVSKISSDDSDTNDYSVTSSGSNTGIVIKRTSRPKKATKSAKSHKLATSPLRNIRIQAKRACTLSDNNNSSASTSTPRSPVILPPKKNRKRIMNLSDTEFDELIPENLNKRLTRASIDNKNKKQLAKDIEEVIIDSSEDADQENGTLPNRRQTRSGKNSKTDVSIEEKDPLEIITTSEESEIRSTESTPNNISSESNAENGVAKSDISPVKNKSPEISKKINKSPSESLNSSEIEDNVETPKQNKRTFKRLVYSEETSEDSVVNEALEKNNESIENIPIQDEDKNSDSKTTNIDAIALKYSRETPEVNNSIDRHDNETIHHISSETPDAQSDNCENDILTSMRAIHGTEEVNSNIASIAANNTLELLATISGESPKEGINVCAEDSVMDNQLNLQLTPEAESDKEAESANDNEEGGTLGTHAEPVIEAPGNVDVMVKASSEGSVYEDAVGGEESGNVVTILADISFTSDGECTSKESLIQSDDINVNSERLSKRKRNIKDAADMPLLEFDETPRTKRVRFAAEKKVLNEDDSVCLEDIEGSEGQKEALSEELQEQTVSGNPAEVVGAEEQSSLDI